MADNEHDMVATAVTVRDGMVHLNLSDGSFHAFPIRHYPLLRNAPSDQLQEVTLRVGGRALRWESLDEDIWVADAVCQNYPRQSIAVAESSNPYRKT